jgi:hypothetical protein
VLLIGTVLEKGETKNREDTDMASIREHVETVFAALPFAERNLSQEARELLPSRTDKPAPVAAPAKRADNRPRVRV